MSSESKAAREIAQSALQRLADLEKQPLSDILKLVKDYILRALGKQPLRTLPWATQVGHVAAMTFCMQQKPPIFAEEMADASSIPRSILVNAIETTVDSTIERLVDAEDIKINKLVDNKLVDAKTMGLLFDLRLGCLELLCEVASTMGSQGGFMNSSAKGDHPGSGEKETLHNRIIGVFFKSLPSRHERIVAVAKRGLSNVIKRESLQKELLTANLRPILQQLGDFRKLSVVYLQGLARVLELLSHSFNVTLGEKLLDHLKKWTEPAKIAAAKIWPPGTEPRVAAAILELFHLLPPQASRFLKQLVAIVVQLES